MGFRKFSAFKKRNLWFCEITCQSHKKRGGKKRVWGSSEIIPQRYSNVRVTEGDGGDASVAIFTLPSVCISEMLQLQFQALYLLIGMQPTHY